MENQMFGIIEIYGRQAYAGSISEHRIGENSFIRIDVPASEGRQAFTKLFNQKAVFSITPTDENTVNEWLKQNASNPPVHIYKAIEHRTEEHLQEEIW